MRKYGLFYLVLPSIADLRQHYIRLHKVFRQSLCMLSDHFFRTSGVAENTSFSEKGYFSSEKNYLTGFSRIIEYDKRQGTTYNGQTRFFDKYCASYIISYNLRGPEPSFLK